MKRIIISFMAFSFLFFSGASLEALEPTKLADGVYGIKGPGMDLNTGFVVGDRGVFVYGCAPNTYHERMEAIRKVAGNKPIRYLSNGHYAADDSGCNHLIAEQGASIIGTPAFAKLLLPYLKERLIEDAKAGKVKKELVEGKRVELAMPTVLFDDKLTLNLGSHLMELHYVGTAHTPDNTIVWLPKEKVLFVDDLLFVELHPTADDRSDVVNWQRVLRRLAGWSPVAVVPGHGVFAPGNGSKPLLDMDRYFETMRAKIQAMKAAGKSLEEIKKGIRAELGEFAKWPRERAIPETAGQVYHELTLK